MSNRRQVLTVDEALAKLLEKNDGDFFGGEPLSELMDSESGSDEEEYERRARSFASPSVHLGLQLEVEEGDGGHFVARELNVREAVRAFVPLQAEPSNLESDLQDKEGEHGEVSEALNVNPNSQSRRHTCGCSKNCLDKFDASEVEQMRMNMLELEKKRA